MGLVLLFGLVGGFVLCYGIKFDNAYKRGFDTACQMKKEMEKEK